jgi:protocatechuate 3,4-dioxygenase, alpha subunit
MSRVLTPSQTVGPFFSLGLSALCRDRMECGPGQGKPIVIRGRILDGDGEPVPDALLEVWRVNDSARENCSSAPYFPADNTPMGFARIATNERGEFHFSAAKPVSWRDEIGLLHAPHLAVVLLMRGLLRHLLTRVYFEGEAANDEDVVLKLVPPERRGTLIARPAAGNADNFCWDIHLQGDLETVFLEA